MKIKLTICHLFMIISLFNTGCKKVQSISLSSGKLEDTTYKLHVPAYSDSEEDEAPHYHGVYNVTKKGIYNIHPGSNKKSLEEDADFLPDTTEEELVKLKEELKELKEESKNLREFYQSLSKPRVVNNYVTDETSISKEKLAEDADTILGM